MIMESKTMKLWLRILIIICVLVGAVRIEAASLSIVSTALNLVILNDNARLYNEQSKKTDEMTAEWHKNQEERQQYYNSSNFWIRTYSRSPVLIKWGGFFIAILLIFSIPIAIIAMFVCRYEEKKMIRQKIARKERQARLAKKEAERAKELLEILIY